MANKKVNPKDKRIFVPFSFKAHVKDKLKKISSELGIPMSRFVEDAIIEKIQKVKQNNESLLSD